MICLRLTAVILWRDPRNDVRLEHAGETWTRYCSLWTWLDEEPRHVELTIVELVAFAAVAGIPFCEGREP